MPGPAAIALIELGAVGVLFLESMAVRYGPRAEAILAKYAPQIIAGVTEAAQGRGKFSAIFNAIDRLIERDRERINPSDIPYDFVDDPHFKNLPIYKSNNNFNGAESTPLPRRSDPLILDLDGDGIETIGVKDGAYFDHDVNGFAEQTGWASPDDGFLVFDRNADGVINDGKELFGDQTILKNGRKAANGFEALAELDDNGDGKIDINDAAYTQLRIWQDSNGDGYSSASELKTLSDLGIKSISINSAISNITDANGNTQTRTGNSGDSIRN